MKYLFKLVVMSVFLSACSVALIDIPKDAFAEDQIYQGYPCLDECEAFKRGFDLARKDKIQDVNQCDGSELKEITGCRVYVNEFKFENRTFDQLITDL